LESRKVQKVGHSTMTVSLPSDWAKQHNINPGDAVLVTREKDGTLKIVPGQFAQIEEIREYTVNADACNEKGMLERIIVGSYILGFDIIKIISSNRIEKTHVDEIRSMVRKLFGMGILEETSKNILLQCSIDLTKFKLDMLIRRLSLIASTILSETMQALLENNETIAFEAIERENEADIIYYLAVRLLLSAQTKPDIAEQIGITNILHIPSNRLMLQYLELTADYAEDIAKRIIGLGVNRNKILNNVIEEICHFGETSQTIFQKAVDCVFTGDFSVANNVIETEKLLKAQSDRLMKEMPEIPFLRAIISLLENVADISVGIANVAINRAMEKPSKDMEKYLKVIKHAKIVTP
jgi:phosphate uptake regulator